MTNATRDRVLQAWTSFVTDCAATVAPEATYQAWFAHYLIEQYDVLRVVREVDFGAKYLLEDSDKATFGGHNLMTDVVILREPVVDLPRRAWLAKKDSPEAALSSGLGRLGLFESVCEMKVGSPRERGWTRPTSCAMAASPTPWPVPHGSITGTTRCRA